MPEDQTSPPPPFSEVQLGDWSLLAPFLGRLAVRAGALVSV
jgi:hypothetical protein